MSQAASRFGADVAELLGHLSSSDRRVLTGLVSRLLVAQAADQGIELFPGTS
ncbi:MAG TPA: hypothetical protein VNV17_09185 [Solirubrobacteraceae bacterium]|nr:hypothetical protein [Solirubrobacteraceae bacterium]